MPALHVDRDQRGNTSLGGAGALNRGEEKVVPLGEGIDPELANALIPKVELLNEEGALTRLMPSEDVWGPGRDVGTDEEQVLGRVLACELGRNILKESRRQLCIQPGFTLDCLQDLIGNSIGEAGLLVPFDSLSQGQGEVLAGPPLLVKPESSSNAGCRI